MRPADESIAVGHCYLPFDYLTIILKQGAIEQYRYYGRKDRIQDINMTSSIANIDPSLMSAFTALSTDQQLATLWFIYKEVGKSITPAAPGADKASPEIAEGLFKQVLDMSQDEQLQVQRDLVEHKNGLVSREYGALSNTTKLLFWYLLAQGMDRNEIIPMPDDYSLESQATEWFQKLQRFEHSKQLTILRDLVADMGVDPLTSPHDEATGL
jgi:Orange carotenoid protein, N-terminal